MKHELALRTDAWLASSATLAADPGAGAKSWNAATSSRVANMKNKLFEQMRWQF
ncbi:MAG: hypothetical protein ABI769_12715 [Pseudomonadota bacterium]